MDGAGRSRAAEDHAVVFGSSAGFADNLPSVFPEAGCLAAGSAGLGVGVGVERHHLLSDKVFNKRERPPGGCVISVCDSSWAVGSFDHLVVSDDGVLDSFDERVL